MVGQNIDGGNQPQEAGGCLTTYFDEQMKKKKGGFI